MIGVATDLLTVNKSLPNLMKNSNEKLVINTLHQTNITAGNCIKSPNTAVSPYNNTAI